MISPGDPFLVSRYAGLNDTGMQRKLQRLRPWPVGVVFIERPGMTREDIRGHFRQMKALGFNCLKQCQLRSTTDWRAVYHMALDEGIIPWWYGEAANLFALPLILWQWCHPAHQHVVIRW